MQGCVFGRWRAVLGLLAIAAILAAPAAAKSSKKKASGHGGACADSDDEPDFPWQRFKAGDTCVEFTNTLTAVYQNVMRSSDSLPAPLSRGIASRNNPHVTTFTYEPSLDTTTPTGVGDFKTTLELSIKYGSDGSSLVTTLSDGTAALAGATVGYTDSVMNFWDGEGFQFSATAPSRTVGVARYEHEIGENSKLGLSLESGLPTSRTSSTQFAPIYANDPVLAGRWLYETDRLTLDLAAMVHQLKFGSNSSALIPALGTRSGSVTGWAVTAGATVAVPFIGDDDNVSMQATYAVNSSPYLGTNTDLSALASVIPFEADTRGWSVVISYHRAWSEQWESNVFVSRLALDIGIPGASPAVRSTRLAANLKWSPVDYFSIGAEVGHVELQVEPNGTLGILSSNGGQQLTGYIFAEFDF